jgi:hypothetical protein
MKKIILALTVLVGLAAPVTLTATAAEANPGSPNCMTVAEWRKVHKGMSRAKVKRITGIWGNQTGTTLWGGGDKSVDVDYKQCRRNGTPAPGSWNTVYISFDNYRYDRNYNSVRTGMNVDYKGSWSSPVIF